MIFFFFVSDVMSPVFDNCPMLPIEVEIYHSVEIPELKAYDNSGLVRSIHSTNFANEQIISQDVNASFIAEDFSGNKETCTIEIKVIGKKYISVILILLLLKFQFFLIF